MYINIKENKFCSNKSVKNAELLLFQIFQIWTNCLLSAEIFIYPDFEKDFILKTDPSNVGIGAVLSQLTEKGDSPIAFSSRALNSV